MTAHDALIIICVLDLILTSVLLYINRNKDYEDS